MFTQSSRFSGNECIVRGEEARTVCINNNLDNNNES